MGWGTSRPDAGGETESLAAIAGPISVGRGDRAEAGANLCPGQPAPQPESGAGDVGAGDLESWPTKRLWKRRSEEKSKSRFFLRACKSRKKRAICTFPQPRRRPFSGYIFHVSTAQPKVTFSNGLTRMGNAAHAPFLEDRRGVKSNGGRITSGVGGSNLARFAQYCDVFVSSVTSSAARLSARGQSRGVEKPAWRAAQNSRFSTALGMTASLYFAKPNSDAISLPGQD